MLDSSLLYGIVTLSIGLLALLVRYAFRSKCTSVRCCFGLIDIQRDVDREDEIQENGNGGPHQSVSNDEEKL